MAHPTRPPEPFLSCEPLETGGALPAVFNDLAVYGWALDPAGIAAVEIEFAGRALRPRQGLPSPYLADDFPDLPGHENAHFELHLDTTGWPPGERELVVRARTPDGREAVRRGPVEVMPFTESAYGDRVAAAVAAGEVAVALHEPRYGQTAYAPVIVSGFAYAAGGVERVDVIVDGRDRYEATFPLLSPDARRMFDAADAFSCGFRLMLSPAELPAGDHTVAVLARTPDGRRFGWHGPIHCAPPGAGPPVPDARGDLEVTETPPPELLEQFDPEIHEDRHFAGEHVARYRWAGPAVAGRSVLDAGCGVGWGSDLLARAGAAAVTGVDVDSGALAKARERYGERIEVVLGDVLDLPFEDGAFDVAVCFEVIEHVRDGVRALAELRRVLRPDGVLLLSSPNRGVYAPGNPFHRHEYTAGELEAALRREFAHVRLARQQTYVATIVGETELLAHADPEAALPLEFRKAKGHAAGEELYTLAVAGDGDLPELDAVGLVGGDLDVRGYEERLDALSHRLAVAEAEEAASRVEAVEIAMRHDRLVEGQLHPAAEARTLARRRQEEAERGRAEAEALLVALQASPSWRITAPLRAVKRAVRRGR